MWRSATLAMEVSSTSMKVEIETTLAMTHGLPPPAAERSGDHPPPPPEAGPSDTSAHLDARLDGEAGAERAGPGHVVEGDLHRHPLDDLHIVAGGVLAGQQGEGLPRAALDGVDLAVQLHGAGIDAHVHRLA